MSDCDIGVAILVAFIVAYPFVLWLGWYTAKRENDRFDKIRREHGLLAALQDAYGPRP